MVGILGLKSALNYPYSSMGLLEIVPRHRHAGLWENPELSRCWHAHSMGSSIGLIAYKISRTQGLVRKKVGMVLRNPVVDVEGLCNVLPLVPLP